jgi:hypothetical protein
MHESIRKELDPENTESPAETVQDAPTQNDIYTAAKKAEYEKMNSAKKKS